MKHLYLVAVIVFWSSTVLLVSQWGLGDQALSYIASSGGAQYVVMLVSVLTVTVLVLLFLNNFFFSHVGASDRLRKLFYVAYVFIVLTTAIPAIGGSVEVVHAIVANLSAFISIAIYYLLIRSPSIQRWVRVYTFFAVAVGLIALVASDTLTNELIMIGLAHSCMLLITYTKTTHGTVVS